MEEPPNHSVRVSVPPRAEFLALLRTITGSVATRMQLPLDTIDDLRLAVDEAVAFLLTTNRNAARVEMRLVPGDAELMTTILADSHVERWPPRGYQETLSWQVISGLTDAASISRTERGAATITFRKRTPDARPT